MAQQTKEEAIAEVELGLAHFMAKTGRSRESLTLSALWQYLGLDQYHGDFDPFEEYDDAQES